jgi:hypothetical protein
MVGPWPYDFGVLPGILSSGGAAVPINTVAPVISGSGTTASPLTVAPGVFSNGPILSRTYQFKRDGAVISGATGTTYTYVPADSGTNITVEEIASNAAGPSAPAVSNAIAAGTVAAATFTRPTDQPVIGTGILNDHTYQCDTETGSVFGVGKATVAYPVTVTANGWIWVRLRDKTTGLQVGPLGAYSVTTATTFVSFDVPGRLGWGYVDMSTDASTWATFAGTLTIGAGDQTLGSGQSLMGGFYQTQDIALNTALSTGTSGTVTVANPYTRVFSTSDSYSSASVAGVAWSLPADGTVSLGARPGAGAAAYLHWMAVARNRNQSFAAHGWSGSYQSDWQWTPTGSNNLKYTQLTRVIGATGGKYRYQFWWQGHADSDTSVFNYANDMDYREFGAAGSGGYTALNSYPRANVVRIVNTIPNLFLGPYYYGPMRNAQAIRIGGKTWCAAKNDGTNINGIYVEMPGLSLTSDPHPGQLGNIEAAKCLVRAALSDNLGPKLLSATRDVSNPNDLILTFQQTGTDFQLTGSWWKRVAVYLSGSTVNFVGCSTGSRISATQLRVTMVLPVGGANWGDADAFDIIMGAPWDGDLSADPSGNMIRDDRTDSIDGSKGRPFQTGTTPITAVALNGAGTHTPTANYPATAILNKSGYIAPTSINDIVMVTPTYDSVEHKTGFGFPLIGGRGTTRTNQVALNGHGMVNSTVPMTMVCRIKAPTPGATNRTIVTWGSLSLGYSSAGKVFGSLNSSGSATMAAACTVGSVYWIAIVGSLTGMRLYTCIEGGSVVQATALAAASKYSVGNALAFVGASGSADFFAIAGSSIFDWGVYNTDTIYTGGSGSFSPPSVPLTGFESNIIFADPLTLQNDPSLTGVQADLHRAP